MADKHFGSDAFGDGRFGNVDPQPSALEVHDALDAVQPALEPQDGDPLDDWLTVIMRMQQRFDTRLDQVYEQRYIDTAIGASLDTLGNVVDVDRDTGEGDESYRRRVKTGYIAARSSGTYEEIAEVAKRTLGADAADISLVPARDTSDPATAKVKVQSDVLNNAPFTNSEIGDMLGDAAVGGHRITVVQQDAFTWGDSSLGWGTDWATVIK